MTEIRPIGGIVPNTPDGWELFSCQNTGFATIQVVNGMVDLQVLRGSGPTLATWDPISDTLVPGSGTIVGPLHALRFKNHDPVSSPPPQIAIRAEGGTPLDSGATPGWTPGYIRLNPDGTIGALFTGGLEMRQGTGWPPSDESAIVWRDEAGGRVATIANSDDGAGTDLMEILAEPGAAGTPALVLGATRDSTDPAMDARLTIKSGPNPGTTNRTIFGKVGTRNFEIMDGAGQSSYTQIEEAGVPVSSKYTIEWIPFPGTLVFRVNGVVVKSI